MVDDAKQHQTPEGFYRDVQYKGSAFRLRIDRELVEDELGVESVDRSAFEDWYGPNMYRILDAALAKYSAASEDSVRENRIVVLNRGDLNEF